MQPAGLDLLQRADSRARCAAHGLALGRGGRCALCRSAAEHAASRSTWVTGLSVFVCAIAGGSVLWHGCHPVEPDEVAEARPSSPMLPHAARARAPTQLVSDVDRLGPTDGVGSAVAAGWSASSAGLEAFDARAEDLQLGRAQNVPLATRVPAPHPPDPPPQALDPEAPRDDPSDFDLPVDPAPPRSWSPPL